MTIKSHLINAVATAAVLGAGTSVVSLKVNDARQDDRIARIEHLDESVSSLSKELARVDKHLSQIDGRFQGEHDEPR